MSDKPVECIEVMGIAAAILNGGDELVRKMKPVTDEFWNRRKLDRYVRRLSMAEIQVTGEQAEDIIAKMQENLGELLEAIQDCEKHG